MGRTTLRVLAALSALLVALFITGLAPALAAVPEVGPGHTEDNDTNDNGTPNNVSDEGDNQHPSGKDRSIENGRSGNQGRSGSDPDDDGNGPDRTNSGPDKPNGSGGADKADQDDNNGCGNDDDFEDDNEGWCSPGSERQPSGTLTPLPLILPVPVTSPSPDAVLPSVDEQPETPDSVLGDTIHKGRFDGPSVLGDQVNPSTKPAALPFTGGSVITIIIIAVGLLLVGALVMRARRAN